MKRKRIALFLCLALLLGGAYFIYSQMNTNVVYAVTKDDWVEVYRSVSKEKAMNKFEYLQYYHQKEDGVFFYVFVDEETGNSIIP